jgi:hypothetical protein
MSFAAASQSKDVRRSCERCRDRKARFRYRRRVRADRHHTLCFACFRSERERQRARRLASVPPAQALQAPFGESRPALSRPQVAHRRRMLAHLGTAAR